MHWFWRGMIAVVAGMLGGAVVGYWAVYAELGPEGHIHGGAQDIFLYMVGIGPIAVVVFAFLTRRYRPVWADRETRCRKCHYILKGVTEPRCPECGERI